MSATMSRKLGSRAALWVLWLALLPACAASVSERAGAGGVSRPDSLVILHTNDTHAWLLPFEREDGTLAGGAAARADLLRRQGSSAEGALLLDAGDVFQGTPLFN